MSSFRCPPGLLYLAQVIPGLLLSPVLIFCVHQLGPLKLPNYAWFFAYLLATPAMLVISGFLRHLHQEREISKLGAQRVPRVHASWPGGLDTLLLSVRSYLHGYIGDVWADWIQSLGPIFHVRIVWQDLIVTTEPSHIKAMLATQFDNFEKGENFRWYAQSVLGDGVFNSDGDMWKFHRAMTRPFFARDRVTDFELFNHHAETVVMKLKERFAQGEAIDFQDIMSRFTLDSATEFLFGSCVQSLAAFLPYAHNSPRGKVITQPHSSDKFAKAFRHAQEQIALRNTLMGVWPLFEFWKDKAKDAMKDIHTYMDPILKDALEKKATVEKMAIGIGGSRSETLLDHLVHQTADYVIIRDEAINIMIAGRDSTMALLTFVVYCLSQYPAVLTTLREEVLTKVGTDRRPTFEDIKECRYLHAVINETLRLYPPVPINLRHSKQSTTWPSPDGGKPYYIPARTDISYCVWLMHRRTDLWGPDAEEFDPDRFLDARLQKYLTPNPFIFLPFNAGPRICLGQQFAYNETSVMLIRLVQAFDTITLAPEAQPPDSHPPSHWKFTSGTAARDKIWPKSHLTLYSHGGVWLRMREAQHIDTV